MIEDTRESQALGLFGRVQGSKAKPVWIKEVHVQDIVITGGRDSYLGGLAGIARQAIIQQVSSQSRFTGESHIGGLIGFMINTRLAQAYSYSAIQASRGTIGGLVGYMNSCYLAHVHSHTRIDAMKGKAIGGLIGSMYKSNALKHAYSQGTIRTQVASQVGGLVGEACNGSYLYDVSTTVGKSHIYDAYSTVDIEVGKGQYPTHTVGGLIGHAQEIKLERAYSTGAIKVEQSGAVGGVIGSNEPSYSTLQDTHLNRIRDVYSLSSITVEEAEEVGGLIGWMLGTDLQRAYSQGAIKVKDTGKIGGLIGFANGFNNFADVYSISSIEARYSPDERNVRGLIFFGSSKVLDGNIYIGGLIGLGCGLDLERAYSAGSIHTAARTWVGGLGGSIKSDRPKQWYGKNHIRHVYSRSAIEVGAEAYAAGLIAVISSCIRTTDMHFFGTLTGPSSALIRSTYVRQDSDINPFSEPYEASGQATDSHHFPGWFAEGFWLMGPKGPELTWSLKQDALSILQYANHLVLFKSFISELPMELLVCIFQYTQFYGALHRGQMTRLLYYALAPFEQEVKGEIRKLWTKEAFLNYVLFNTVPLLTGQKRNREETADITAKKKRL